MRAVLVAALGLAAAGADGLSVEWTPRDLAPGVPLRINVRGPAPGAEVAGSFLERDLTFLPDGRGGWVAFAGIDLDTPPGEHVLAVEARQAEGDDLAHAAGIKVGRRDYPTESLTVEPKYVEPPPEVAARIAEESALLESLWSRSSPQRLHDGRVVRPLPGVEGRNFGRRRVFNGQPRSPHSGTDLSAPAGTPVEAASRGRVALARDLYFSGNLVVLDHGGGVYTLYAHLSRMDVAEGELVDAGQVIGRVGATGRVTGPHLPGGARIGSARVDPALLLELMEEPAVRP